MSAHDSDMPGVESKPPRRVLVVEDNFLAAAGVLRLLREWGYEAVGPVSSVDEGCNAARSESLCGAILDVSVRGGSSEAIGRVLASRHIPYIYVTGFNSPPLSEDEGPSRRPRLFKPIDADQLRVTVGKVFAPCGN